MRNEILRKIIYDSLNEVKECVQRCIELNNDSIQNYNSEVFMKNMAEIFEIRLKEIRANERYSKAMEELYNPQTKTIVLSKSKCISLNSYF